jgi:hypothetical protein
MIYLSWNLAKNVRVSEPKLFEAVKHTLMRSLRQVVLTAEFLKWKGLGKQLHFLSNCYKIMGENSVRRYPISLSSFQIV